MLIYRFVLFRRRGRFPLMQGCLGVDVHLARLSEYRMVSYVLPIFYLRYSFVHSPGHRWSRSTKVGRGCPCHPAIRSVSRASFGSYALLATLTVATMGLSNYAVVYLNYP